MPPAPGVPAADRFATITKVCAGVASELRATLGPLTRDLGALRRHDVTDEQLDTLRRRLSHAQELVASLRSIGFGERAGVTVVVKPSDANRRLDVRGGAKALAALARELVAHAVAASPKGATVEISVSEDPSGARLVVDDAGSPLPASGRRAFLALEAQAGQYGRPSGLPIFMAAELAACIGARLELSDAPAREGTDGVVGGGLRVAVTFAAS
ncbi:hypothetical protein BH11MYX4_BH11MYX4_63660 [soil metagenome]